MNKIQTCKICVMDSTDPTIIFDDKGVCDYVNNFNNKHLYRQKLL